MLFQSSNARHIGKDVLILGEQRANVGLLLGGQVLADFDVFHGLCLEWVQGLKFRPMFGELFFGSEDCRGCGVRNVSIDGVL